MRHGLYALAVTIAATLALAAPAAASFPGERPAPTDPQLAQLVTLAEGYWHARGVTPCPEPHLALLVADNISDASGLHAGFAETPGCRVWLDADLVADGLGRSAWEPSLTATTFLCGVVVHELGHTGGLPHVADGVMRPDAQPPAECQTWGRMALAFQREVRRAQDRAEERAHRAKVGARKAAKAKACRSARAKARKAARKHGRKGARTIVGGCEV